MNHDPIPLVDLKAAHLAVAEVVQEGMQRVLDGTSFILGEDVQAFEEEFAHFVTAEHCVGVASGTDALELILRALDIGPGAEVIVPANTFIATASSVVRAGATPVFVDCDNDYLLMDTGKLEAKITEQTRAIVPVHLYGQVAPMAPLARMAERHGIPVIEDAAQAHGAVQHGHNAGCFGVAASFSFYPGKNLGAHGDGGAVVTNNPAIADRIRLLRNYGSVEKYQHPEIGFNSRLDSMQAVVLRAKLDKLANWNAKRREAAQRYDEMLSDMEQVVRPAVAPGNEHVFHLYVIRVPDRDRVLSHLHENGIGAGVHYPKPLHLLGAFEALGNARGDFPVAEAAADEILSLPMFPQITAEQQRRVVDVLHEALG